jgi:hypothetical protein
MNPFRGVCVSEQRELQTRASPYAVSGSDLRCPEAEYTTLQFCAPAMLLMIVRWAALAVLVPSFVKIVRAGLQV